MEKLLSCQCHDLHHAILDDDFIRLFLQKIDTQGLKDIIKDESSINEDDFEIVRSGYVYKLYDSLIFKTSEEDKENIIRIVGIGQALHSTISGDILTILTVDSDGVDILVYVSEYYNGEYLQVEIYKDEDL